ncbi:PorT family protein [Polaribacter sp.]|nr:PorT family protein [Polaribacter sp.]MDB4205292.1 PorT family protein [Polaribacter sp.]MDC1237270.1 PorT family protein [Polaribacter sp.]
MKKIILMILLAFAFSQTSTAQLDFGVKAGLNYNSESIQSVSEDVFAGAESKTGYHAGIWLRFKLPIIGFYLRPELVYTNLENELLYKGSQTTSYNFQKIDIPVLIGKKFFGIGNVFAGPSIQYILNSDFSLNDIENVDTDGFTVGLQFGAGIELNNLGIDVRWERGLNTVESTFLNVSTNTNVTFDTRVNQIIIGLSYKF